MNEFMKIYASNDSDKLEKLNELLTSVKSEIASSLEKTSANEYVYLKKEEYEKLFNELTSSGQDERTANDEVIKQMQKDLQYAVD